MLMQMREAGSFLRGGQAYRLRNLPTSSSDHSYTWVQLADTQLGMMAAFKKVQWQRCLISAATCGRLKFPPCIESDGAADAEDENVNNATLMSSPSQDSAELAALELELARRGVEAINSLQPVPLFAVVCGDLVHAFPDKDPEAHAQQVGRLSLWRW